MHLMTPSIETYSFTFQFCHIAVLCVRQSNLQGRIQTNPVLIVVKVLGEVVSSAEWGKFTSPTHACKRLQMPSVEECDGRSP